ncbi:hypothetical protein ACJX0J_007538, partial [Zea mays]
MFCTFETMEDKMRAMATANLRHRVLPPQLLLKWPKEASFCQLLMHPVPETRPKMSYMKSHIASRDFEGIVQVWDVTRSQVFVEMREHDIGTIKTRENVCSVQFQPDTARSIAIGSADHKIYCYDLRHIRAPYCTLVGHTKTVSYVKYLDASTIVSASTDNSLKLWDLSMSPGRIIDSPVQTFKGHTNTKVTPSYIATICDGRTRP